MIFGRKIQDECQLETLDIPLRYRVNIRPVDVAELYKHPDNSKPVERRGRKAMDLKLVQVES